MGTVIQPPSYYERLLILGKNGVGKSELTYAIEAGGNYRQSIYIDLKGDTEPRPPYKLIKRGDERLHDKRIVFRPEPGSYWRTDQGVAQFINRIFLEARRAYDHKRKRSRAPSEKSRQLLDSSSSDSGSRRSDRGASRSCSAVRHGGSTSSRSVTRMTSSRSCAMRRAGSGSRTCVPATTTRGTIRFSSCCCAARTAPGFRSDVAIRCSWPHNARQHSLGARGTSQGVTVRCSVWPPA
jgi:hypothetical protein